LRRIPLLRLPQRPLTLVRSVSSGSVATSGRSRGAFVLPGSSRARHYAVDDFRAVRAAFGIVPAAFAKAFPNDFSELDPSWRQRLKESVSEGASGSFFYRVLSGQGAPIQSRFIIKQITIKEKHTLMAFLPAYRDHVTRRSGRSLIQYFGCHSMSLWWKFSGKVYFVVMRNFCPIRQWLTFDLKGATANRRALAATELHQIHAGEDPRGGAAWGTLRDWEWMDIAMVCDISDEDKASLAETIARDVEFLSSQGLLDYSLLVGIHRLPPQDPSQREKRLQDLAAAGGYISRDRQRVYFFGIIDVLEKYNMGWWTQNAVLSTAYCLACKCAASDGISALPPRDYADRFRTFVIQEVLQLRCPDDLLEQAPPSPASSEPPQQSVQQDLPRPRDQCPQRVLVAEARGAAPNGGGCSRATRRRCCDCCSCAVADREGCRSTARGADRWAHLWERRRRGLVRERIEAERADHMRRIADLEAQLTAGAAR